MRNTSVHRAPSMRTSSSHRSTIETRGVPEFDREYAHQLSIAKRGRNSNVKASPSPVPVREVPLKTQMHSPAAVAASRIKDYVVTHITPSHNPHLSGTSEDVRETTAWPNPGATREDTLQTRAATTRSDEVARATVGDRSLVRFWGKTILVIGAVLAALLCYTNFVMSVSIDYNPSFFFFSGASSSQPPRIRSGTVARGGWSDRLAPEFRVQVASHLRQAFWQALGYIDVLSVFCNFGLALETVKAYVLACVNAMLLRIDTQLHPILWEALTKEPAGGERWSFTTVFSLAASVVRYLTQFVMESFLIAGRSMPALGGWVPGSITLPPSSLNVRHVDSGNASSAVSVPKGSRTSVNMGRVSSTLFALWRPLHSLWIVLMPISSLPDTTASRNNSAWAARTTNAASSQHFSKLEEMPLRTPAKANPDVIASLMKLRTMHTRILEGALWSSHLDRRHQEVGSLARDDIQERLHRYRNATREVEVALRAGGLGMDLAAGWQTVSRLLSQWEAEDQGEEMAGMGTTKHTRFALDAQLQRCDFPHLRRFYSHAISTEKAKTRGASNVAPLGAVCEAWVTECQQQCVLILYNSDRELHKCTTSLEKLTQLCDVAAQEAIMQLHECSNALTDCRLGLSRVTADVSGRESRAEVCGQNVIQSPVTVSTARQAVAVASAVSNESFRNCEAERKRCAAKLAVLSEEARIASTAAAQKAEAACTERLAREVSMLNSSAATAASQMFRELEDVKLKAGRAAEECGRSKRQAEATCEAVLQRMREGCETELLEARASSTRLAHRARDEGRQAQPPPIFWGNEGREEGRLAAQYVAQSEAPGIEVSHLAAGKYTTAQQAATIGEERSWAMQSRAREESQDRSEAARRLHKAHVCDVSAQITVCTAQLRAVEALHQKTVRTLQQMFYAAPADSSKEACLQVTQRNVLLCSGAHKALEKELHQFPLNASPADAFTPMLGSSRVRGNPTVPLNGTSVHSIKGSMSAAMGGRSRRFTFSLHVASLLLCLASVYTLVKYSRKHRLYEDAMARLDTLIAVNETTISRGSATPSSHSKRSRARHRNDLPVDDRVSLNWTMVEACLANNSGALLAWHFTRCASLLEQEIFAVERKKCQVNAEWSAPQTDALASLSDSVLANKHALFASPGTASAGLASASTLSLNRDDDKQLSQLHIAFVSGYYGVLEMYYLDSLDAVVNCELVRSQLQRVESVATRHAAVLHNQSTVVAGLQGPFAQKGMPGGTSAIEDRLDKANRRICAQEETIALLKQQLKISREELSRVNGVVHTPALSPRGKATLSTAPEPANCMSRQAPPLQELADGGADSDSISVFNFSNVEGGSIAHRALSTPLELMAKGSPARTPAAKRATMVRNPDTTRRYHKLQWDDDVDLP
ncbi:hypothetical protein JKF63_02390 [Porcisia hertigi]|uniref:Transmembrane protein n=1 Tax=Porcisia hertigi TaxID=2761500 RepID=A0A836H9E8_9TRYP|nr:hypothetical protein JKF63_02390 [Porcisia hertigi]